LGRLLYIYPLGFIATGLFDGIQMTHTSSSGRFGLGVWYTGFLFKKTANITMTNEDVEIYSAPFSIEKYSDTYFAPKRAIAAFDYQHLAIGEFLRLNMAVISQFDLNKADDKLDSQYFVVKFGIPAGNLLFELGGSLAAMQTNNNSDLTFAGEFGMYWVKATGRLALNGRMSSGLIGEPDDDSFKAFIPITNNYFGEIFQARMTSLSVLSLGYSKRLSRSLGTNINVSYFMRHDLVTDNTFPINAEGNGEQFLGAELFARFVWSPFSDLQFNLGAGAFIPSFGNVWQDETPVWRIDLAAALALF